MFNKNHVIYIIAIVVFMAIDLRKPNSTTRCLYSVTNHMMTKKKLQTI